MSKTNIKRENQKIMEEVLESSSKEENQELKTIKEVIDKVYSEKKCFRCGTKKICKNICENCGEKYGK